MDQCKFCQYLVDELPKYEKIDLLREGCFVILPVMDADGFE